MALPIGIGKREIARRQRRIRELIGAQIAERRAELGVSQAAVGEAAGIDQAHVSRIERGHRAGSVDVLVAISACLSADLSIRLFPRATLGIRDRLQAPMVEALVRAMGPDWRAAAEVPVPE